MAPASLSNRRLLPAAIAAPLFSLAACSAAAAVDDRNLPESHHMAIAGNLADAAPMILAARRYAAFWNTGDEQYARLALAPDFIDRTLPVGRPQGVAGPLQASQGFRAAVPDLAMEIDDMVVAGDRVSLHLHFRGHFSGQFGKLKGKGQAIDFQAFDLYRIADGRIADNWHLEDNLSLMQQFGAIQP
ncbi:snoaL-like polyketide cyclase family protein [Collimonas fungivorans]|uniref:SnoaL-like polyketide cyclase family protein n=1 Tax=Collimonas fungivorans TaxID=158899 RepID=A0A127P5Z1_9BURK|nr:ester cyclase [Collimonas fungivorans]AMO93252.1 snoaL-like polyketide cyclase family protein [Collimonas fungivorans]